MQKRPLTSGLFFMPLNENLSLHNYNPFLAAAKLFVDRKKWLFITERHVISCTFAIPKSSAYRRQHISRRSGLLKDGTIIQKQTNQYNYG